MRRKRVEGAAPRKLGELASTAICGNDITSSCPYVSALAIIYAGHWGPVALLLVAAVLYLFRSIYGEVVGALPLNGGAYNALLNTTSKFRASLAACLTILSCMATAVISASEASHYAHEVVPGVPVFGATIGLLAFFMVLTIVGITESSVVAIPTWARSRSFCSRGRCSCGEITVPQPACYGRGNRLRFTFSCPGEEMPHILGERGGVRVIV